MEPPQLRCAEAPMRTSLGAPVPMFVDESVGNIWVQECQELGGASRRKRRVHGPANYSLKLYLSAKSGEQHISRTTCLLHITYTETRNTLFYRFLPFWLASLISRVLVVFGPTIGVLIRVLRSIPYFYRWRIRTRIYRWYRALLSLERELFGESDSGRREQLLKRLDEIEQAVNRMKVPASFAEQFYSLRGHIGFVRQMVGSTQQKPKVDKR